MLIILHVLIAITSIIYTGYVFFYPSRRKITAAYGLAGLTLLSGTLLVISLNTPLLRACSTGLLYLGVTLTGLVAAQRKLAILESKN